MISDPELVVEGVWCGMRRGELLELLWARHHGGCGEAMELLGANFCTRCGKVFHPSCLVRHVEEGKGL